VCQRLPPSARGASLVEYLIVVGAIALAAMAGFIGFGDQVRGLIGRESECVRTFQCEGGTYPTSEGSPPGQPNGAQLMLQAFEAFRELDDPAEPPTAERARELIALIEAHAAQLSAMEMASYTTPGLTSEEVYAFAYFASETNNLARRGRDRAFQVVAAENSTVDDVLAGFFVDGAWGTVTGVWGAVTHPIDTVTGVWHAGTHPVETYNAVTGALATQWEENPSRLLGAGIFEVVTIFVAPAKVARATDVAGDVADLGRATRVVEAAEDLCPAGICSVPARRIDVGSDLLVPRSDGTISLGRVVDVLDDGRLLIEVPTADGGIGTKILQPGDVRLRKQVDDLVMVPRGSAEPLLARVTEVHPDGTVTIAYYDDAGVAQYRRGPEHMLMAAAPDATRFRNMYAFLPEADKALLEQFRFSITVQHHSVAAAIPAELVDTRPRGYPPGSTWRDVQGVYLAGERRIVVSVDEAGRVLNAGSINIFFHETGHAIDHALGMASLTDEFRAARAADFAVERPQGALSGEYFRTVAEGGAQESVEGALSETYAEAYALYLQSKKSQTTYMQQTYPELWAYFERQAARAPPPPPTP